MSADAALHLLRGSSQECVDPPHDGHHCADVEGFSQGIPGPVCLGRERGKKEKEGGEGGRGWDCISGDCS